MDEECRDRLCTLKKDRETVKIIFIAAVSRYILMYLDRHCKGKI
jgi:hypothetical protein